ncbi:MAG: serine acetyltransferase [Acidobacteria bacterium]|nr:serine acetyltransferase [Acidobacteriota bacterium]
MKTALQAGESLSRIVTDIRRSYEEIGNINHIEGPNIPSTEVIIEVLHDLQKLVFPGFHAAEHLDPPALTYFIGEKCSLVLKRLAPEICRSLEHHCRNGEACIRLGECRASGHRIATRLLSTLPEIRRLLNLDVEAAFRGDPAARSREEVITCYPGMEAITVHRIAHFLHREGVPLIPRIMSEHIHGETGIDIHPGATIGEGFFIDHGTGVVIGETTLIGNNVKIYQGVTLGALSVRKENAGRKRHPTLEDDVTLYAGATILGGETVVGKGSVIGGNVWLTHSVPPGTRVTARSEMEIAEK